MAALLLPSARGEMLHPWAVAIRYVGMLVAATGLWLMRKWALYAYLGFWLAQVVLFLTLYGGISQHGSPWFSVLGPIIVCATVLPYWRKLT